MNVSLTPVQLEGLLYVFAGISVITGVAAYRDSDSLDPSHARFVALVVASFLNWLCFVVGYLLYYGLIPLPKHFRSRYEPPEKLGNASGSALA